MKKVLLAIVILAMLIPGVLGYGSIQTIGLAPSSVTLCGSSQQYVTISPAQIQNRENDTLVSVTATLHISGNSGLSFITMPSVNIGDISPLSLAAATPSWTLQCNSPVPGVFTAYVNYSTGNGYAASGIDESVSVLTIQDTSGFFANVSIIEGMASSETPVPVVSDDTPTIRVQTSRDSICKGSLDMDKIYENMDFMFYGTFKDHNYTFLTSIAQGAHKVYVRCSDSQGSVMQSSQIVAFRIDASGPGITVISPPPTLLGDFTDMKISTDEDASCRFGQDDDTYPDMAGFDDASARLFSVKLTGLEEKFHEYRIICKDNAGNQNSMLLTFEAVIPPKAKITLEKTPPLSKETYLLYLTPSKTLRSVPTLTYKFTDDDAFRREVTLIKDGSRYKGYIIIDDQDRTRSGLFLFKGYDLDGNEGTEITEGAAFLVDTIRPAAPEDITVSGTDEGNQLDWYYSGEKPDHFNVYRSASQGIGPIHFYDSVQSDSFTDDNVLSNQLYYYAVSAVDKAGNVGAFSKEVSVYAKAGSSAAVVEESAPGNPPTEETRQWKEKLEKDVESFMIDLDFAETTLKDQSQSNSIIEELGLVRKVTDGRMEVEKLKLQLASFDSLRISDTDLRDALSKGDALLARSRKTLPQSLEVVKSTSSLQATAKEDIQAAVDELLAYRKSNYSDSQIDQYLRDMKKLNDLVKVESEIKTISIRYIDTSEETRVYVSKGFTYESPDTLSNAMALEIIPKTVAGDASSLDILTPNYLVVKEDPVIAWGYETLSYSKETIKYVVLSDDVSESAKTAKTVILLDPSIAIKEGRNMLTGFSIFFSQVTASNWLGILLGGLIVAGLAVYYFVVMNDVKVGNLVPNIMSRFAFAPKVKAAPAVSDELAMVEPKSLNLANAEALRAKFPDLSRETPLETRPDRYFHAKNGDIIRSITEMADVLKAMDDFTYRYHAHGMANDFADWINNTYHNPEVAMLVKEAASKQELIQIMEKIAK